mgnify:CR=1 FL=1
MGHFIIKVAEITIPADDRADFDDDRQLIRGLIKFVPEHVSIIVQHKRVVRHDDDIRDDDDIRADDYQPSWIDLAAVIYVHVEVEGREGGTSVDDAKAIADRIAHFAKGFFAASAIEGRVFYDANDPLRYIKPTHAFNIAEEGLL